MAAKRMGGFLIDRIHQLSGRLFTRRLKDNRVEEINPAQGRILFVLWQNDGISIHELSQITSLGQSTLTSMLDRLEQAGYLRRVPSSEDRRKIMIRLVNRDDTMRAVYEKVVHEISDIYYKGFDEQEVDAFEGYLKRILKNLENEKNRK